MEINCLVFSKFLCKFIRIGSLCCLFCVPKIHLHLNFECLIFSYFISRSEENYTRYSIFFCVVFLKVSDKKGNRILYINEVVF